MRRLINLLHLGCIFLILQWGDIIVLIHGVILWLALNLKAKLDHAVNATSERLRLLKGEPRGEQRGLEEKPHQVLDGLAVAVLVGLLHKVSDDSMEGIDLQSLLRRHV